MQNRISSMSSYVLVAVLICLIHSCNSKQSPADLNKETVLKIAKDTAIKVYGNDMIQEELPLVATLKSDSIWVVTGTLHDSKGGTVYIEILDSNKKVRTITHYK